MPKTDLHKEWEIRIAEFRSSGLTQAKWCEMNQIKLHQLRYWLRKIERNSASSSTAWVPLTIEGSFESKDTLHIKIGQAFIEVKPGFDPSFLADVVRTLRSLC